MSSYETDDDIGRTSEKSVNLTDDDDDDELGLKLFASTLMLIALLGLIYYATYAQSRSRPRGKSSSSERFSPVKVVTGGVKKITSLIPGF